MKKFHLIAAIFLCQCLFAQNWANLPGLPLPSSGISRFYDDTATGNLLGYGSFDSIGTISAPGIAAWDGTSWNSLGLPLFPNGSHILSAIRFNGDLYLSGGFPGWNSNTPAYLARWNGTSLDSIGHFNGGAFELREFQNTLIMCHHFPDSVNGVGINGVSQWDGTDWFDLGQGAFVGSVFDIIVYNNTIYATGFSSADNLFYVFRYVNNVWQTVGSNFSAIVNKLCIYNNELYAGGGHYNSNAPNALQKLDTLTDTWNTVGGGVASVSIAPYSSVVGMYVYSGALYVTGAFDHAGGVPAVTVAKWDGTQWCGLGIDFNSSEATNCVSYNGDLYLSTGYIFDNDTTECFVKWLGGNFTDTCGFISTGLNEQILENISIKVFPNPATETATFQFSGVMDNTIIHLYDALGREVWNEKVSNPQAVFSVEEQPRGMYFYRLEEEGKIRASGKLIIE